MGLVTIIVEYPEGDKPIGPSSKITKISEGAAITITNNCGECLLVERSCGNKLSCKHPRAMQLRPYTDTADHKNERRVTYDSRPEWCPL